MTTFQKNFTFWSLWVKVYIWQRNKGVSFLRNCAAASVGEYNEVICYYQLGLPILMKFHSFTPRLKDKHFYVLTYLRHKAVERRVPMFMSRSLARKIIKRKFKELSYLNFFCTAAIISVVNGETFSLDFSPSHSKSNFIINVDRSVVITTARYHHFP